MDISHKIIDNQATSYRYCRVSVEEDTRQDTWISLGGEIEYVLWVEMGQGGCRCEDVVGRSRKWAGGGDEAQDSQK